MDLAIENPVLWPLILPDRNGITPVTVLPEFVFEPFSLMILELYDNY